MANHKSALKRVRQERVRRERNRQHRSKLRTEVKKIRQALADGETETATALLRPTLSLLDRSVKLGVLPANAAARRKSRISRALNKLTAGS